MKLYEINQQIEALLDACTDHETGEFAPTAEAEEQLAALEIERGEKAINLACYLKGLDAEAVAIAEEESKLRTRRQSINRRIEWLKNYLEANYQGESIKDPRCVISWRKSTVVWIDERLLGEQYWRVTRDPMKQKIKDDIKSGIDVPGARLHEVQHIQIK